MRTRSSTRGRYRSRLGAAALGVLLGFTAASAATPVRAFSVFACEPEWAALVRVLMPDARVYKATHARQDPHHIEARPALIAQLRDADLAVCTGAALEAGWLPMLQQRAGNPRVQDGAAGMFYAADHVSLLDPHVGGITPFDGDVHPDGNPHLQTDPRRLLDAARSLSAQLQRLVPTQAVQIDERYRQFEARWKERIRDWERRAGPLRGRAVAAQHATFAYLWNWLGITQNVDLEPKPGMAPTPGHLQRVIDTLRAKPPLAVVAATYQDPRPARWIAGQLDGVLLLELPATVTDDTAVDALEGWFEQLLQALTKAAAR